ncbi:MULTISPECIES: hypothetical protein [Burkholderia]|nr:MULTISPECIES: hypothetical protein [Burkholderia]MDP9547377.1 hypothetical protein [Burkholderia cepacia]MBR8393385.1 hypothetical protein [Burkholderia cenocepacia]MBR8471965.1 hypothetical protein [Burkholderia cenocepacia]MBR8491739.1 hypothetical protein [Burkholderia cenocepacia]MDO5919726.1 hypothetical protein [Burkholderia cenocepacia]
MSDTTDKSADALTGNQRQRLGEALSEYFGKLDSDEGIRAPEGRILRAFDYCDSRNIDDLIDRAIAPALAASAVEQHEAAPTDDEQLIEAMARAMNVATDGHDRYWTGFVPSAGAALRALRSLALSAPLEGTGNGADERAAQMAHDLRCAGVAGTKAGDLLHAAAEMLEALAARAPRTEVAGAVPSAQMSRLKAIIDAVEGECDGLAIDENQAARILMHLDCTSPNGIVRAPRADAAAAPADERAAFDAWFADAWNAYPDKETTSEIKSKVWALKAWRHLFPRAAASHPAAGQEAVGEAGAMPGTDGFTMAVFRASDVPLRTKLYTAPPAQVATRDPIGTRGIEGALADLIDRIVPGLDSGDILADAKAALNALATRQGLTDERIEAMANACGLYGVQKAVVQCVRALLEGDKP